MIAGNITGPPLSTPLPIAAISMIFGDRNIDSYQIINDQIIANIRICKFCISDFTMQSNGGYFEVGFALGLGNSRIILK